MAGEGSVIKSDKSPVSNMEKGKIGIVNIYQIVKGDQPIKGVKFGPFDPNKSGNVRYPQGSANIKYTQPKSSGKSKEGKNERSERINVEKKLSGNHDNHVVAWRESKQAKNPRLAWVDPSNTKYTGPYLIPTTDYGPSAREKYNQILSANPGLIKKDFSEQDKKRLSEVFKNRVMKIDSDQVKFEEAILRWAMNYRMSYNMMKDIYIKWKKSYNEKRIAEEAKIKEGSSPLPSTKSDVEKLGGIGKALKPKGLNPSDYPNARIAQYRDVISRGLEEVKNKDDVDRRYSFDPSTVYLIKDGSQIRAFTERPRLTERRKKHIHMKSKRSPVKKIKVKKQSRSSAMKKTILKKIKCNCRRR